MTSMLTSSEVSIDASKYARINSGTVYHSATWRAQNSVSEDAKECSTIALRIARRTN